MKLLILLFLCSGFYLHDIQVAFFKIHEEGENFTMEVVFEQEYVKSTFDELDISLTDENLSIYLSDNLSLTINNNPQTLSFGKMQLKGKHIYLTSNEQPMEGIVKSLEFKNTCLLSIEDHSNIVELRLNGIERDFLMNRERTIININY